MALLLKENIKVATDSIKGNKLRAFLTMLIIFFGITALVGISSAIDAMKGSINSNFTSMGANSFTIRNRATAIRIGKRGKKAKIVKPNTNTIASNPDSGNSDIPIFLG